jgi:hypothetical protein
MKTPIEKAKFTEKEIKWLDLIVMSVGSSGWKSIFEVRELFDSLIPPYAIYRKASQWSRGRKATIQSLTLTHMGSSIRYAMRAGFVERTVPIHSKFPRNIGNYHIRLTDKGKQRLKRIRRYLCLSCLSTNTTRAHVPENVICGHCRSHHVKFY